MAPKLPPNAFEVFSKGVAEALRVFGKIFDPKRKTNVLNEMSKGADRVRKGALGQNLPNAPRNSIHRK